MDGFKKSPLEELVEIQQQNQIVPVKIYPKDRLQKSEPTKIVVPILEDDLCPLENSKSINDSNLTITNSNLVVNLNLNIDSEAIDKAFEKSIEVAKKVAAAGAAVLGTAILFSSDPQKIPEKIKIPLKPKVKVPKFNKD